MSVESIAIVLHHSEASGTPKVVLLGIANHDGDGGAWPAVSTLARYANVAPRRIQTALRSLEALGELKTHRNQGGMADTRADHRPNRYEILLRCPADCDGSTQHRRGDESFTPRPDGVSSSAPRGDVFGIDGVTETSPEPSLEPSLTTPVAAAPPPRGSRRTDPRSDAIAKGWWETQNPKPMQDYLSVRAVVSAALKAGWAPELVARALAAIGSDPPVVKWKLERELARTKPRGYQPADPRGLNAGQNVV